MFTPRQYRARANEYSDLIKGTDKPAEIREFRRLEHNFTELADNGDWMANNWSKSADEGDAINKAAMTEAELRILGCLGAAVIMQWNTLPTKLQRELFDNASSVGDLLQTGTFRPQMARFLHKHKNDEAGLKV